MCCFSTPVLARGSAAGEPGARLSALLAAVPAGLRRVPLRPPPAVQSPAAGSVPQPLLRCPGFGGGQPPLAPGLCVRN